VRPTPISDTKTRAPEVALDRTTWKRFVGAVRDLARSKAGGRAGLLFATLLALMLAINALNVVNSYVGRDFMTAIERQPRGVRLAGPSLCGRVRALHARGRAVPIRRGAPRAALAGVAHRADGGALPRGRRASDGWDAVLELRSGGAWAWQPAPKQGVA